MHSFLTHEKTNPCRGTHTHHAPACPFITHTPHIPTHTMSLHTSQLETKANKYYNSALSTLNRRFGLGNKYKQALPKLQEAAAMYKSLHLNYHAGAALQKEASCHEQLGDATHAARIYSDAAECFMNYQDEEGALERYLADLSEYSKGMQEATNCYQKSSNLFAENGNLLRAAQMETQAGEAFEQVMLAMMKTRQRLNDKIQTQNDQKKEKMMAEEGSSSPTPPEQNNGDNEDKLPLTMDEDESELHKNAANQKKQQTTEADEEDEMMKRIRKERSEQRVTSEDISQLSSRIKSSCLEGVNHYRRAADYFEANSNYPNANTALKRAADIAIDGEQYKDAIKILEKIFDAEWNREKSGTGARSRIHFDTNQLLFKILLCKLLIMDVSQYETQLEIIKSYMELYEPRTNNFEHSREGELIITICGAFEKRDMKRFLNGIALFEKIGKLDDDTTRRLLKVRRKLEECLQRLDEGSLV